MTTEFRALPSVDRLLAHPLVQRIAETYQREAVLAAVRRHLERAREGVAQGESAPSLEALAEGVAHEVASLWQPGPRPVINATGVILHTNLGRAPLSEEALSAVAEAARGYSNLELDVEEGERGSRQQHVGHLLAQLTGAEAALVVNNNAAAVALGLAALARSKEVIVSRGEAVEIGGGFRIPDVLHQSGAALVDVGTTNRTYVQDYQRAITPNAGAILKVHTSNFRIVGFVHEPTLQELAALGREHSIPVLYDLGSGCLLETEHFGLAHEPTPQESIRAGADLVFFSGDKLLGGPQAGIVVGKQALVAQLSKHPLARALRIDKLDLAALSATLLHYLKGEATRKVPVWQMVSKSPRELEAKAQSWAALVGQQTEAIQGHSTVGGGSLPGETLPTWLVAINAQGLPGAAQGLARRLRQGNPPIITRIVDERVVVDPRTVLPHEEPSLVQALRAALGQL
ncbi:MAG: L-seryl-tRNA(Sec) selenium transferase [Chloroflexi bacterium]|nr:L-seryl-tRNA(Sec) selenium transferase [Chloroflexota bacterium]